jgi:23S rRNA (pseudouridine1915-N3)-methyltransferase
VVLPLLLSFIMTLPTLALLLRPRSAVGAGWQWQQHQHQQAVQQRRAFRATPTCGLKVEIHLRGKRTGGEEWMNEAYMEYAKRLRPVLALETVWHKTDQELEAAVAVAKEKAPVICLDERGKQLTSMQLADCLYKKLEEGGSRLAFVIGGAEGLPQSIKASRQYEFWSLSNLTFTHQFARVLLTEQLYRASEIRKGSGYHKE